MLEAGEELIAEAQRVVQAMAPALPGRLLAARGVLARHPPARDLRRLRRSADGVDDEDIADVALHLGRDVGVVLVHVEAVDAAAPGLLMFDELRLRAIGHIVELETAMLVGALLCAAIDALAAGRTHVLLDVD